MEKLKPPFRSETPCFGSPEIDRVTESWHNCQCCQCFKLSRRFLDVWNCFRLMGIKCWQLYTYLKFKLWEMYYLNTSKPYRLQFNTYVFIDLSIFIINMTCGWLYSSAFLSVFAWNMLDIVNNFIDVEWMTTKVGQWDWKDTISMSTMWECKHNF